MLPIDDMLGKVTEFLQAEANTTTVIGKEFKLGDYTCVPVVKIGIGFGSGGGEGKDAKRGSGEGGGAGAALSIEPLGFLVSGKDDIHFVPASNKKGVASMLDKVPDVLEKYFEMREKHEPAEV